MRNQGPHHRGAARCHFSQSLFHVHLLDWFSAKSQRRILSSTPFEKCVKTHLPSDGSKLVRVRKRFNRAKSSFRDLILCKGFSSLNSRLFTSRRGNRPFASLR